MAFKTKIELSDRLSRQLSGTSLTLSGTTNFAGVLQSKGIEIDVTITTGVTSGNVLTYVGGKVVLAPVVIPPGTLGAAPDGFYGNTLNVAGIMSGDTKESAFDKISTILDAIAPAKPQNLSQKTFIVPSSWSATLQGTSTVAPKVINVQTPTIPIAGSPDTNFYDGSSGVLTATVSGASVSARSVSQLLTNANDAGTYVANNVTLIIGSDNIFNGIWNALSGVTVQSTQILPYSDVPVNYILNHTKSGTKTETFVVDDIKISPQLQVISATMTSGASYTVNYISGVPGFGVGSNIATQFTVRSAITYTYNSIKLATIIGTAGETTSKDIAVTNPPAAVRGSDFIVNDFVNVNSGIHNENVGLTLYGFNSRGDYATASINSSPPLRVDTISNETIRKTSGTGTYPPIGIGVVGSNATNAGSTYVSAESLSLNSELQLFAGVFRYPSGNYTGQIPSGPNYTGLGGVRWATFDLGPVTTVTNATIHIANLISAAFDGNKQITTAGFQILIKIDGAIPSGWLNLNLAYASGIPNTDGDACLDVSNSDTNLTPCLRRATFGTVARTGRILVKIAVAGSTTFTSIN